MSAESAPLTATSPRSDPILEVHNLVTRVGTAHGPKTVVDDVSFDIHAGETLCIAGESGSGKSMTSLSIMGLLPPSALVSGGQVLLQGRDILALNDRQMQAVRGNDVAMIFQEPMTSLNPVMSIGAQLIGAIRAHHVVSATKARQTALDTLDTARISDAARRLTQFPHELSGGMRQRVMIAMALAGNPGLLIADEPTTALDVTIQLQILALIDELKRDFNTAVMLITHDMGVVAEMADRVVIMKDGRLVEVQPVVDLFQTPREIYTRDLLAAVPRLGSTVGGPPPAQVWNSAQDPSVVVRDLTVRFDINGGLLRRVGLDPAMTDRHPHEFSGGQRQRICIARALSLDPRVIVADEAVSALDVSVQAQVLDLMGQLQDERQLSYLFISHDMAVVEQISHRVAVMYLGQIVEIGPRDQVFENPRHPYTKRLFGAVPIADPQIRRARVLLGGEVPSPIQQLDHVPDLVEFTRYADMHFAATG